MADRSEQVAGAAADLRAAINDLKVGDPPRHALWADVWPPLGRGCIVGWVDDAERAVLRVARALELADAGPSEQAEDETEVALWAIIAAREKLEAVFVLSFGVPSMEPYGRTSAKFEPNTAGLRERLRQLAQEHRAAAELGRVGRELAEHQAVALRNQLSHQLSATTEVKPLCYLDIGHVRGGTLLAWDGSSFYGQGALDGDSIAPEVIWKRTVDAVSECFELLVRTIELMSELIAEAAVLEPPQRVFVDNDTGAVSVRAPRLSAE
jgi:hypothetical protein